jgi:hypothetical protein
VTIGRSLFSLLPPAFAAVLQYLFHITVELLALTEPDKRLSHTSGSSVCHSVRLRSTTRVQVFADPGFGPAYPSQGLAKAFPGVYLALALAVEPFEQDMFCAIVIVAAPLQVIRYGVVAQVAHHSRAGLPEHLPFLQDMSGLLCPVRELAQALPQLLTAGTALDHEVSFLGLPAVMREAQKGKLLRLLASSVRILAGKSPKCDAVGFLLCQLQPESFESVPKALPKTLRIVFVLKTGQKIIGKTEVVRFAATLLLHPPAEPQVQRVVQVDVRQQRGENGPLRRALFTGMHKTVLHDATFQHPDNQSDHALVSDSMSQEFDHPLLADIIKGSHDTLPTSTVFLRR